MTVTGRANDHPATGSHRRDKPSTSPPPRQGGREEMSIPSWLAPMFHGGKFCPFKAYRHRRVQGLTDWLLLVLGGLTIGYGLAAGYHLICRLGGW